MPADFVREKVRALQTWIWSAIHVPADYRIALVISGTVLVVIHRSNIIGRYRAADARSLNIPFAQPPSVIGNMRACRRLAIDFFAHVLTDIANPHITRVAIKTGTKWIAQAKRPYLIVTSRANEWIGRWNGIVL